MTSIKVITDAVDAKDLAACVQCGLCLSACPTFRLSGMEGYSPRGRIAAIRAAGGEPGGAGSLVDEFLDTCLGCRACEAVCPSGVKYGRILEHARATRPLPGGFLARSLEGLSLRLIERRGRLSLASLAPWAAQRLGLMRFGAARGLPRMRLRNLLVRLGTNYVPPQGTKQRGQVVLFTGCVQDAWSRDVHWATIAVLCRAGYRVRVPHGQVCCGALHAHGGRLESARRLAAQNLDPLERYEGRIVVDAAGCGAKLKEYDELLPDKPAAASIARRTRDVSEALTPADVRALGASPPPGLGRIAMHDPCHLNFVQGVHEQPRALLRAAGYEVVDLPDGGRCCGAAGSFAVRHSDWARPLLEQKMDACRSVGADAVAVANPGCLYWMGSAKDAPRMYHPIQLLAMAMANSDAAAKPAPR